MSEKTPPLLNLTIPIKSPQPVGFIAAPIQKLAGASEIIEFLKGVQFQNSHHRREYRCNIGHLDAHHPIGRQWGQSPGGWEQKSTEDYLQINLSYPRYVTHIGTAGENFSLFSCQNYDTFTQVCCLFPVFPTV